MPDVEIFALTVENLHKRFGALEVLKGVSLQAREGDVISILGTSGSGKSTLLRCINLLENPDDGVVTVAGETIKMRKLKDGRAQPIDRRQVDRDYVAVRVVVVGLRQRRVERQLFSIRGEHG